MPKAPPVRSAPPAKMQIQFKMPIKQALRVLLLFFLLLLSTVVYFLENPNQLLEINPSSFKKYVLKFNVEQSKYRDRIQDRVQDRIQDRVQDSLTPGRATDRR